MPHRIRSAAIRGLPWLGLATVVLAGCAAGDPQFSSKAPAGFWLGMWHGLISFGTLIIGIVNHGVKVYEVHNTGGWYDFGFLIGVTMLWGHRAVTRPRKRRLSDAEWQEISRKVEAKLKRKIRGWAEAEPDEEWNVVEKKAEDKLKRKVRQWADEP
jgi:hypothetical protein